MRECAYFDIKYDRSYPALYAQLSPTFNRIKGYSVSGFQADSYGAEFLIFNATDTALNLDETTGNYLRIQGITFTQDTSYQLTVDEYFKKQSNLSDPELQGSTLITSPLVEKAKYDEIKLSRLIYGKNDFAIESAYIQSQDDANELMGWIINKIMKPKKSVGMSLFSIPTLQLGDIVTIDYKNSDSLDLVAQESDRFVVYNIGYGRSLSGPSMTVYLSEV
jgi:phospholipase/lecithinase/hemolysin